MASFGAKSNSTFHKYLVDFPISNYFLFSHVIRVIVQAMKRRRKKPKTNHFTTADFDISNFPSQEVPEPAEKPQVEVESSLSQSRGSDHSRDESQILIDEQMKKRREVMEKKMLRKKTKSKFHQRDLSGLEPPAPLPERTEVPAEVLSPPEEAPVVSQSGQGEGEGRDKTPMDFSNLLEIGDDEDQEEEETLENVEKFVANQRKPEAVEDGRRRKSVYQAGQNTSQQSLLFDQSEFRPVTESTRLASVSSVSSLTLQLNNSPAGAKPGRDTSTPFITRRQQALSKSAVLNVPREDVGEKRANQTTAPRLTTPRVGSLVREARKSGLAEHIIEGATQTSPHLEADVGCQVTPSLAESSIAALPAQVSALNGTSDLSAGEKSSGLARRQQMNDLTNILAEEVNIDLPPEEEDGETEELQQNITNSGRRNPSPISERRNEVDEEEEEEEVFVDQHQGTTGEEDLVSVGDEEEVKDGHEDGREVEEELEDGHEDGHEDVEEVEEEEVEKEVEEFAPVTAAGSSLASLTLPEASSSKAPPSSREVRELRQATLTRYLGLQTSASPLVSPLNSPEREKVVEKPKPRQKAKKKEDPKLIFPPKQVKFEFQRFSRYKLKAEAESALVKASQDFLTEALLRMSRWAEERGAANIHLSDIKRMMEQCGFVSSEEQDPHLRYFHEAIRDIGRREHVEELIPCNLGRGEIYPPKDCWEVKGEKKKKSRKAKADKVKRLKVSHPVMKFLIKYLNILFLG